MQGMAQDVKKYEFISQKIGTVDPIVWCFTARNLPSSQGISPYQKH